MQRRHLCRHLHVHRSRAALLHNALSLYPTSKSTFRTRQQTGQGARLMKVKLAVNLQAGPCRVPACSLLLPPGKVGGTGCPAPALQMHHRGVYETYISQSLFPSSSSEQLTRTSLHQRQQESTCQESKSSLGPAASIPAEALEALKRCKKPLISS